jgi:hypothetical protein
MDSRVDLSRQKTFLMIWIEKRQSFFGRCCSLHAYVLHVHVSCSNTLNADGSWLLVQVLDLEPSCILIPRFNEKQSKTVQLVPWTSSSFIN